MSEFKEKVLSEISFAMVGDVPDLQKLYDKVACIDEQIQLNDNQQIVFEWLKEEYFDSYVKSVLSNLYFYVNMTAIGDLENRKIQLMVKAYEELDDKEFIQVLAAFAQWALEQEEAK